jgi:hypothetical protein
MQLRGWIDVAAFFLYRNYFLLPQIYCLLCCRFFLERDLGFSTADWRFNLCFRTLKYVEIYAELFENFSLNQGIRNRRHKFYYVYRIFVPS